jgi:hypothetical protein
MIFWTMSTTCMINIISVIGCSSVQLALGYELTV